ncbi:phospholipase D-like domain-containing protein [Rhizobium sp. S163]|uniref:phospholipase D-like domain-containing protein n=1 Tax=Rhizobium sp. S163 TaxID=3055039 RepID=UPI0025A95B16|nr:phospholipase D-like domain-containing protein [Rhizobium sp. S163]MDM9645796.1 phospholipase D-like domain-containing protein [Rhizobium sp. S163]
MRKRVSDEGITVNAVAGSYVVLLGWTIDEAKRASLRGFAIRRKDFTEGETYWMKGVKTFESVEKHPAPGEQFSSLYHPFQSFQWADYSAKPDRDYEYEIVAMYGDPANLRQDGRVKVKVHTEPVVGQNHSVFFNRGSPATQEYARRFENKLPSKAGPGAYEWLSRGLLESIVSFIDRAKDSTWSLKGAFYEFQWPAVLEALKAAETRGVKLSIIYDDIESDTGPWEKNEKAIEDAGLAGVCKPRQHGRLMHNKFLVLSEAGKPQALLFGSTNLTENGIFGHANCVHIIEGEEPGKTYLKYLDALSGDPEVTQGSNYKTDNADLTPAPTPLEPRSDTPVFSPRPNLDALDWYGELAEKAVKGLFMTFAFGMNDVFANVYAKTDGLLRMALMEKEWNGRNKEAQIEKIRRLQALPNVVIAVGNRIPLSGFDQWLGEMDRGSARVNVHWVHTKFMLADPLSADPIVITGSANFSKASTDSNDENMVVIRGNHRVADIYLGEFFRLHSHYAFRQAVAIFIKNNPGKSPEDFKQNFLIEDRDWTTDYFTPGDRSARFVRRIYFSGS